MDNRYLKIIGFIAVVIALTAVFKFVTGDHLGPPDESLRMRHPDGYSIVGPKDWVGTILQTGNKVKRPMLKFVPDENVGVQPSLLVSKDERPYELPGGKKVRENARTIQFQGQPATFYDGDEQNAWMYVLDFKRGDDFYRISLKLAVRDDVLNGMWWKYFETFRLETSMTENTTHPTTLPNLIVPEMK